MGNQRRVDGGGGDDHRNSARQRRRGSSPGLTIRTLSLNERNGIFGAAGTDEIAHRDRIDA